MLERQKVGDPLLTDNLGDLLTNFPNTALHGIVGILKRHTSWSIFPAKRATAAHTAGPNEDLHSHAHAIAREILWWGSNDILRQIGTEADWQSIVCDVAKSIGVPSDTRKKELAWQIEEALLAKALADWEKLSPKQREEALKKAGADFSAIGGGALGGIGGIAGLGGAELLALIGAEGAGYALASAIFAPIAVALGAIWAAFSLAGPGYRVLQPVALTVAYTRRQLRTESMFDSWSN